MGGHLAIGLSFVVRDPRDSTMMGGGWINAALDDQIACRICRNSGVYLPKWIVEVMVSYMWGLQGN